MDYTSDVLPFIYINLLFLGCKGVSIVKKYELAEYNSCGEEADQFVNLTCRFQYDTYTTAPYLSVTWTDVTNSSNILNVANIIQNGSVNARGEYENASITRLSDKETDGSIRLMIPDIAAMFKIFDCEVNALSDTPSIAARPVFAYNMATVAPPSAALGGAIIALSVIVVILCAITIYRTCTKKGEITGLKTVLTLVLVVVSVLLSIAAIILAALYLSKERCCYDECSALEISMVVCCILGFVCLAVVIVIGLFNRSGGLATETATPRSNGVPNRQPDARANGANSTNPNQ